MRMLMGFEWDTGGNSIGCHGDFMVIYWLLSFKFIQGDSMGFDGHCHLMGY
jgi:hypothetical protein